MTPDELTLTIFFSLMIYGTIKELFFAPTYNEDKDHKDLIDETKMPIYWQIKRIEYLINKFNSHK